MKLSHTSITQGDTIFKANENHPHAIPGSKTYIWTEHCHIEVASKHRLPVRFNVKTVQGI